MPITRQMYFDCITDGIWDLLPTDGSGVTDTQKIECVSQMISNLNTDTVNPDHVAHPVIKG